MTPGSQEVTCHRHVLISWTVVPNGGPLDTRNLGPTVPRTRGRKDRDTGPVTEVEVDKSKSTRRGGRGGPEEEQDTGQIDSGTHTGDSGVTILRCSVSLVPSLCPPPLGPLRVHRLSVTGHGILLSQERLPRPTRGRRVSARVELLARGQGRRKVG